MCFIKKNLITPSTRCLFNLSYHHVDYSMNDPPNRRMVTHVNIMTFQLIFNFWTRYNNFCVYIPYPIPVDDKIENDSSKMETWNSRL